MRYLCGVCVAALLLTACAGPVVVGGMGAPDRLYGDWTMCRQETFAYALIPDFGIASYLAEGSCMKDRGWERDHAQLMGWRWIGADR